MPKFAANLSMMFTEVPFLERFGAAAAAGFRGVEYLFPYEFPAEVIHAELATHNLQNVLFNLPPGNWAAGERGIACIPGREQEFLAGVATAATLWPRSCSNMWPIEIVANTVALHRSSRSTVGAPSSYRSPAFGAVHA